jgi:ribonuclease P protein component
MQRVAGTDDRLDPLGRSGGSRRQPRSRIRQECRSGVGRLSGPRHATTSPSASITTLQPPTPVTAGLIRHEAHLPTLEDAACPHARISRAHEDTRRLRGHQRAPRQGPQAPRGLNPGGRAGAAGSPQPGQPGGEAVALPAKPGHLIHKADFESLMSAPVWSRSAHFALHHVAGAPATSGRPRPELGEGKLSTELCEMKTEDVDNSSCRIWIGAVVPKRHARRAVTRSLLKRQIREAFVRHALMLGRGLWLVRLRRPFARADFPSARSVRLGDVARAELDDLLSQPPGRDVGRQRRSAGAPRRPPEAVA